jgi:hypothetical protein
MNVTTFHIGPAIPGDNRPKMANLIPSIDVQSGAGRGVR